MQSSLRHKFCRHKPSHRQDPEGGRTAFPLPQKGSKVPETWLGHPAENQVLGSQVPPLQPAELLLVVMIWWLLKSWRRQGSHEAAPLPGLALGAAVLSVFGAFCLGWDNKSWLRLD